MSAKCKFKDACFYQKHRKRLEKCHLIVVNHALFASNLAIRSQTQGQGLLPNYEAVVFDEAHHWKTSPVTPWAPRSAPPA